MVTERHQKQPQMRGIGSNEAACRIDTRGGGRSDSGPISESNIVRKVWRLLFFCTGAVTHNFQIAFERLQYRVKWHVPDHIRPPSTLQNFQYSIEKIFAV